MSRGDQVKSKNEKVKKWSISGIMFQVQGIMKCVPLETPNL